MSDINDVIKKKFHWITDEKQDTAMIKITANQITLRSQINIKKDESDVQWTLVFPEEGGIGPLLGFEKKIMTFTGPGEWTSPKIANILSVNNILVQCDVISGSSINGKPAPVIYNYSPNESAGNKIVAEPVTPIYLPVTLDRIHELNVWVTDQDNKLLDLQEEDLVVTFHMRAR